MGPMKDIDRYRRQSLFAPLGREGQERLRSARVVVIGCGALGTNALNLLVRAGVGRVRAVDRDIVETHNLHRQVLYDEQDAKLGKPKAEAARDRLAIVNSEVIVEARVADLTPRTAFSLLSDVDLIVDGTDNVETRYLINDFAVKNSVPWIYGGAIGATAVTMAIVPGGPCLRCLWPDPPAPGTLPTCDTAGVLPSAPAVAGALQASAAMRILTGRAPAAHLLQVDVWELEPASIRVRRQENCPTCGLRRFDFLDAKATSWTTNLCGRSAVQVSPAEPVQLDLERLARDWAKLGEVTPRGLYLEFDVDGRQMLVFADGRVIVKNTADAAVARNLVARYLGT
jgi:molybdopterin-synthase adenylyltransferase